MPVHSATYQFLSDFEKQLSVLACTDIVRVTDTGLNQHITMTENQVDRSSLRQHCDNLI